MTHPDPRTVADLEDQATAALTMATHRLNTPFRDRAKRLRDVLLDIDRLAAMGHNEAECRLIEQAIAARIDAIFAGKSATDERTARRMELEADTREDHVQGTIAIDGETPVTLELHAEALDRQAAASRTLALHQRRKARVIRETRGVARVRVGLGGAA